MRRDQRETRVDHVTDAGERGGPQQHAQNDRQHTVSALPAVPQDRELFFPIAPPAEPVGGIGEPVLVQRSRQRDPRQHRQQRRRPTREADQLGQQKSERRYAADPGADERKCPGRIGEPPLARCPRIDRQPREEGRGRQKPGEKARRVAQRTLGTAHSITITGLAKNGANDYISARWRRLPEPALTLLDLDRLRAAPLCRDPFDFVVVENFVHRDELSPLVADFPLVPGHGSFPVESLACGPVFSRLVAALTGPALRCAVEEKFGLDLDRRPTMVTVRGRSDGKDGRIHTDSESKIITLLLYLNLAWECPEGRLRLLRGPDDIDDYARRSRRSPAPCWRFAAAPDHSTGIARMSASAGWCSSIG